VKFCGCPTIEGGTMVPSEWRPTVITWGWPESCGHGLTLLKACRGTDSNRRHHMLLSICCYPFAAIRRSKGQKGGANQGRPLYMRVLFRLGLYFRAGAGRILEISEISNSQRVLRLVKHSRASQSIHRPFVSKTMVTVLIVGFTMLWSLILVSFSEKRPLRGPR
jgi:hypothetical protein